MEIRNQMATTELRHIPLSQIRENPVALRQVQKDSEKFLQLVDSVRQVGVMSPISVRPLSQKGDNGEDLYGVIDGLHRYTASVDSGRETIPAQIMQMEDAQVLIAQVIGNIHTVETRPVEYSKQLQRILNFNPTLTISQLAAQLQKGDKWLSERLGLLNLDDKAANLLNDNKMNLTNAYMLAKLPKEEQVNLLAEAQTTNPQEFSGIVLNRKKELDKARKEGRAPRAVEWVPTANLRKMSELKSEIETPKVASVLVAANNVANVGNKQQCAEAGFQLGLKWALNLDPQTIADAKKAYEDKQAAIQAKKDAAKAAAASKKLDGAKIKMARLQLEAEYAQRGEDATAALAEFDKQNPQTSGSAEKSAS